jgi:hypothetical protein
MSRKFLIVSPGYDENVGGHVVLHKLCDLLNERGVPAYILSYRDNYLVNSGEFFSSIFSVIKNYVKLKVTPYKVNPVFNAPVLSEPPPDIDDAAWVVVYSEMINGNPIGGRNIVRWLLHQPGFHTGNICYGPGELHVKYNSAIADFHFPGSALSRDYLKIIHYPSDLYNQRGTSTNRHGVAYCLRKGKGKEIVHELGSSILIDCKSHEEIAKIFKTVDTFISYDSLTAYSRFAALCGCTSIVVPDYGVSVDDWYPNIEDRYGIAYGFGDEAIRWAKETRHLVESQIERELAQCDDDITRFLQNVEDFF